MVGHIKIPRIGGTVFLAMWRLWRMRRVVGWYSECTTTGLISPLHHKLNVFQLMAIYNVCFGDGPVVNQDVIDGLVEERLLLRAKNGKVSMAEGYKKIASEVDHHGAVNGLVNGLVNGDVNGLVNSLKGSLREVYLIVKNNPGIKTKQVAETRGKSESTVKKQLTALKKLDLIEHRDSDKTGGYYVK